MLFNRQSLPQLPIVADGRRHGLRAPPSIRPRRKAGHVTVKTRCSRQSKADQEQELQRPKKFERAKLHFGSIRQVSCKTKPSMRSLTAQPPKGMAPKLAMKAASKVSRPEPEKRTTTGMPKFTVHQIDSSVTEHRPRTARSPKPDTRSAFRNALIRRANTKTRKGMQKAKKPNLVAWREAKNQIWRRGGGLEKAKKPNFGAWKGVWKGQKPKKWSGKGQKGKGQKAKLGGKSKKAWRGLKNQILGRGDLEHAKKAKFRG